ncbi:tRNA synthetases class I family protein, partial [Chlamydia psittaci 01DC11]
MFSDVAIAINPSDIKAKNLLGKLVINPLTKKEIPIIASELIDKDFGTGLMKVSAHAMDDFNII